MATISHVASAILECGHGAKENIQQFVARYKRLFSQMKIPDSCRDSIHILGFARQLHDHCISNKVAKKNLDTVGAAFRFTFMLTIERMLEKRLCTPGKEIFATEASKPTKGTSPCFSYDSREYLYRNCPGQKKTIQIRKILRHPLKTSLWRRDHVEAQYLITDA